MTAVLLKFLSTLNPMTDPAHRHYEAELEEGRRALAADTALVAEVSALKKALFGCHKKMMGQLPGLDEKLKLLRKEDGPASQSDLLQEMKILAEVVALIENDQLLPILYAQLQEVSRRNLEKESELAALEAQLAQLKKTREGYEADVHARERTLHQVMTARFDLEGKQV